MLSAKIGSLSDPSRHIFGFFYICHIIFLSCSPSFHRYTPAAVDHGPDSIIFHNTNSAPSGFRLSSKTRPVIHRDQHQPFKSSCTMPRSSFVRFVYAVVKTCRMSCISQPPFRHVEPSKQHARPITTSVWVTDLRFAN